MALIPPFFLDCVVAIGILAADPKAQDKAWVASGFLYGVPTDESVPEAERQYAIFLVTNRHVFEGRDSVVARFNPQAASPAREYETILKNADGTTKWLVHSDPAVDVAVLPINPQLLVQDKIQFGFFAEDKHVADRKKATEIGISEGDEVYVLGFPMGLVGGERNFVVVRHGVIARVRDALAGSAKEFLVDTLVFPGNSGGPVVTRPELSAIQGTQSQNAAYLLGLVSSYVPYRDVAVSQQTNRPRIIFEENSGLSSIVPIQYVREVAHEYLAKPKAPTPSTPAPRK